MEHPLILRVNGERHEIRVDPERTLLAVVREVLGLTGTKYGCGEGRCGACTLHVDGEPVQACSMAAGAAADGAVTTIEGLAAGGRLHPLQAAFLAEGALQCGYCTPGMIMSAAALLRANPQPTRAEIIHAMQDNICRCGAYPRILAAIERAATALRTGDPSDGERGDLDLALRPEDSLPLQPLEPLPPEEPNEGLFVAYPCPDVASRVYGEAGPFPPPEARALPQIGPWIHIDPQGAIAVYVGKAEVGQNIRTSLAQIVAESLQVPVQAVQVVMGDTALVPYDVGTFGSRTTPITGAQLWRAGAGARDLLLDLAAAVWGVDQATLKLADGAVHHPESGRRAAYGDLARDRHVLRVVNVQGAPAQPGSWTVAGTSAAKTTGQTFVTGGHHYASDVRLAGTLHGKILRPPAFHASLLHLETAAAEAMAGVTVVREGDFVGVVAPDELTATRAVEALRARWKTTMQVSQPELFDYLKSVPAGAAEVRDPYLFETGAVAQGMAQAAVVREAQYTVAYIAHAPLEPRVALARWRDGDLTVWTGTQRPFGVRAELAAAFALPPERVRVIVPDTGAGYGGKHAGDAALEAAQLAQAVGQPVRVAWSRAEEFTWAYFRPAGVIEISGGAAETGQITTLEYHNYNAGAAGIETLYQIPNQRIEFHTADSPLRQGAYRALATTANHFARESFVDELAHALGLDPLEMRLRNLADARLRAVLEEAAARFGWGERTAAPGHGFGLACGFDKGSYVAACVEVRVDADDRRPRVLRVVEAFDCGAVLNPAIVHSQIEGAVLQGLGGALFERVDFANGRILNPSFETYRVPRFGDAPAIETILMEHSDVPSAGAGETPIVAIAPAIGNALFQATGVRPRALPMAPDGVLPAA